MLWPDAVAEKNPAACKHPSLTTMPLTAQCGRLTTEPPRERTSRPRMPEMPQSGSSLPRAAASSTQQTLLRCARCTPLLHSAHHSKWPCCIRGRSAAPAPPQPTSLLRGRSLVHAASSLHTGDGEGARASAEETLCTAGRGQGGGGGKVAERHAPVGGGAVVRPGTWSRSNCQLVRIWRRVRGSWTPPT